MALNLPVVSTIKIVFGQSHLSAQPTKQKALTCWLWHWHCVSWFSQATPEHTDTEEKAANLAQPLLLKSKYPILHSIWHTQLWKIAVNLPHPLLVQTHLCLQMIWHIHSWYRHTYVSRWTHPLLVQTHLCLQMIWQSHSRYRHTYVSRWFGTSAPGTDTPMCPDDLT